MTTLSMGLTVPNSGFPNPAGGAIPWPIPIAANGQSVPVSGASFTIEAYQTAITSALASSMIIGGTTAVGFVSGRIDASAPAGTYYVQFWKGSNVVPPNGTIVDNTTAFAAPLKIVHTAGVDDFWQLTTPAGGALTTGGSVVGLSTTEFTKTAAGNFMSVSATFLL